MEAGLGLSPRDRYYDRPIILPPWLCHLSSVSCLMFSQDAGQGTVLVACPRAVQLCPNISESQWHQIIISRLQRIKSFTWGLQNCLLGDLDSSETESDSTQGKCQELLKTKGYTVTLVAQGEL